MHGDRNGGHPALIYSVNHKKNEYKAVKFTHKKASDRTKLKYNIDPSDNKNTYVVNEPIVDKKYKFGSKELDRYRIHKEDKPLINRIKRKK